MTDAWKARDADRRAGIRATWRTTLACGLIAGLCVGLAVVFSAPVVRYPLVAAAFAVAAIGTISGTVTYMRRIDEVERDANLWGTYIGLCVYLLAFCVVEAMASFAIIVPHREYLIFFVTMAVTLGVYLFKRFR